MSSPAPLSEATNDDHLTIAGTQYRSRLLVGTGKYMDLKQTRLAIEASGAEIVTVAIRRTNIGQDPSEPNLLDVLSPQRYTILPNTATVNAAVDAGVGTLYLFHHDPNYKDQKVEEIHQHALQIIQQRGSPMQCEIAKEGSIIDLS